MCTMTWFVKKGGYELFFNRDESISRRYAEPPTKQFIDDVRVISPTDADAGGTWIAANQFGVTVCLLNHYQYEQIETYKQWTSRGEIVRSFASTSDIACAHAKFEALDLDDYRAFRMFMIDRAGNTRLCVWDGHKQRVEVDVTTPKSSSSVDAKHVKQIRKDLFAELELGSSQDTNAFLKYHSSHSPDKSQESVCMHRDDANTVSMSRVNVSADTIKFYYADGSPCEAKLGAPIEIAVMPLPQDQPTPIAAVAAV